MLLGQAGGQLKSGRTLDYLDQPNRKMSSLFLSLAEKFGVPLDHFGDSDHKLAEI